MTLLDYPGKVACTVFCGGCNLRCPFCHNASLVNEPRENPNAEDELFSYLEKRKGILDGVCVTGGEPLLQSDLVPFLSRVRKMGFSIKLDTNGSLPRALREVLSTGFVDYVAMDLKSAPSSYAAATGVPTAFSPFAESVQVLRESGVSYEFRTTVVKGIHKKEDLEKIGQMLFPEERYFLQGFVDSGNILGMGVEAFSKEEMKEMLSLVRQYHPRAELRGQDEK